MGRPRKSVPAYRFHKASGQAVCTIKGRDIYLGEFNSSLSIEKYSRLCAELRTEAATSEASPVCLSAGLTINEVLLAFWHHAEIHYRRVDGSATKELSEYKHVIRRLKTLYGLTRAIDFGPLALQTIRRAMIDSNWCRTRVNKQISRLRRIFRWAVAQELIPVSVVQSLECVPGLQRGRSPARESAPVQPVTSEQVDATLPFLWPTVRTMVELQRFTGMRPGEVRFLRPQDLDRAGKLWMYRPDAHKMAHLDRDRIIPLGPKAREILEPWLRNAEPTRYLFSPAQAREERFAIRRSTRKSKVTPSQMNRRKTVEKLQKKPQACFTEDGYAAVVRRACKRAEVKPWHPNQLRHTFATEVRAQYGIEAAQVLLGHARADVTQVYAARDLALALRVAEEIG